MPGGKGPSSAGNITQTTVNPTQQAQLPFLIGQEGNGINGWRGAGTLARDNPVQYTPYPTLAQDPSLSAAFGTLGGDAASARNLVSFGNNAFTNATGGGMAGTNSPAYGGYSAIAGGGNPAAPFIPALDDFGSQAASSGAAYGGALSDLGSAARGSGAGYGGALSDVGSAARGSGTSFAGLMAELARQAPGATGGAADYLMGLAQPAASNSSVGALNSLAGTQNGLLNTGTGQGDGTGLTAAARGQYLNSNPYIDKMYRAASDPVVRQYMTATAPQTDSNFEAAGRYGSGSLLGARGQNEQNLGKTLGDLSADIYGSNYANERQLQQAAQGKLGDLGIEDFQTRGNLYNEAGNQLLAGLGLGGNLAAQGASARLAGLQAGMQGTGNAAATANAGFGTASDALARGAGATNAGYGTASDALARGAGATNAGYGTGATAYGAGAGLSISGLSPSLTALGGMQTGFDTGNRNSLTGLALEPSTIASMTAPDKAAITAGQGLTGLQQQAMDDWNKRYYGNQDAPWTTLSRYMNMVGQPTDGSRSVTTPLLGPSPLSSGLGMLGGLGSMNSLLGSGSGGLFGSSGMFGGSGLLGSLFGGFNPLTGAGALGPFMDASGGAGLATEIAQFLPALL